MCEQTPKRDRHAGGVTNDQYVTPRTTLLDGHHDAHQCRDGLGARMRRHRMSATARAGEWPAVYLEMSQGSAQVGRYSLLIRSPVWVDHHTVEGLLLTFELR